MTDKDAELIARLRDRAETHLEIDSLCGPVVSPYRKEEAELDLEAASALAAKDEEIAHLRTENARLRDEAFLRSLKGAAQ